jgi:Dihydrodipicolinate synthetase family
MFTGLMPAMVTPFDERGEVDLGATEAVVERFIEAGVDGISPLGSTGEASHLASAPFLKDGTQKCASDASAALEVVPTPTASLCDSTGE